MKKLPLVSICIPTYNGAEWILQAVNSALRQTYTEFEIVLVDDQSSDGTVELVKNLHHPKINIFVNQKRLGIGRNWNECIRRSKGKYIKFLFQDDLLKSECLKKMTDLMDQNSPVGLVFSRREILIDDPEDKKLLSWFDKHENLHLQFKNLKRLNSGKELLKEYIQISLFRNLVGEPSAAMIRRECFLKLGGFHPYMEQALDIDMWVRIMAFYDVGFFDEPLCVFRVHAKSQSNQSKKMPNQIEGLCILDDLLSYPEILISFPGLEAMKKKRMIAELKKHFKRVNCSRGFWRKTIEWIKYFFHFFCFSPKKIKFGMRNE